MIKNISIIRGLIYKGLYLFDKLSGRKQPLVTVLCYHSIANTGWFHEVTSQEFKKQILYLKEGFDFISISELKAFISGKKLITKPSVAITFDDGYKNILTVRNFLHKVVN